MHTLLIQEQVTGRISTFCNNADVCIENQILHLSNTLHNPVQAMLQNVLV